MVPTPAPRLRFGAVWAAVLATLPLNACIGAEPTPARPNVIVIMSDDQGSVDLGCYGSSDLVTPHADALAARGVRFTQFYAGAPVCSPSRACLLTGRYPMRAGVFGNCTSRKGERGAMPAAEVTLGEVFRSAGYATAHIGKWHLGYTRETQPNAQGFDHSFGHMGGCIDNYSHFFMWHGPNAHDLHRNGEEVFHDGEYFPDLMLAEATAFAKERRDRPFFIYYAINTPHYPYQGEPKWLEHFRNVPYPRNLYAAFLGSQDERIGRLLAVLDEEGLREKTIVVFQSDNGHSTEDRAHGGGGSAGPYRGAKSSFFEGGIRVPAIISWPGTLPAGEARDQVAHAADWLPTLVELCGIEPPQAMLDGASLVPVLRDAKATGPHAATPVHWQLGEGGHATWAVRDGDWKLIHRPDEPDFLANLRDDPGETKNVASSHPEVVERLAAAHHQLKQQLKPSK